MTDPALNLEALEARLAGLERRAEAAEAVLEIQRLKAEYARLVDARYLRGGGIVAPDALDTVSRDIAALFTPDGRWDGGAALGVSEGRDAIAARMREPTLSFSWHFFVKPEIQVDGDRATGRWDILSPCTTKNGRPMWMTGVEHDTYRRHEGQWLHESMQLEVVFMAPHDRGWAKRRDG